jgi:transposase
MIVKGVSDSSACRGPMSRRIAAHARSGSRLVPDELWAFVEPLLPPRSPKPKGGGLRVPDRTALEEEFGCSGVTCWRRLRDWRKAGVFERLHRVLLDRLGKAGRIDWSRASLDSASIPAKKGEKRPEPTR